MAPCDQFGAVGGHAPVSQTGAPVAAHSPLGASGAHRWLNCPGSFALSKTVPARPSSIYAATGTLAHDLIERQLRQAERLGAPPGSVRLGSPAPGHEIQVEGHLVPVDQALVDGVNVMLGYIESLRNSAWLRCEFRVDLGGYFPRHGPPPVKLFGRVDVAALDTETNTLEVIDYKNGSGVLVAVKDNPQLLYYAAGVLRQLDRVILDRLRRVKLTVVQPNAPGEAIKSWEVSPLDIEMWVDEVLVPGVTACADDNAPLNPGSWCRFCPALASCPRLKQDATDLARKQFDDAPLPQTPDDLSEELNMAERAMLWIDAVRDHAVVKLKAHERVPGWDLVPTRSTRRWKHSPAAVEQGLIYCNFDKTKIFQTELLSPARIEKLAKADPMVSDLWLELVESVSSGVKLARVAGPAAQQEFDDVDTA